MIVAEQHHVDARQVLPGYSRHSPAPRTGPGHGACSVSPNRVRQNGATPLLQEHGRVVHESGSQFAALDKPGRYGRLDVGDETWRGFRPAGQFPSQNIEKAGNLASIRIVETLSVKVPGKCQASRILLHRYLMRRG
jgi:hypothetical protein